MNEKANVKESYLMKRSKLLFGMALLLLIATMSVACASSTQPEVSNRWIWVEKLCDGGLIKRESARFGQSNSDRLGDWLYRSPLPLG